jgi:integrase
MYIKPAVLKGWRVFCCLKKSIKMQYNPATFAGIFAGSSSHVSSSTSRWFMANTLNRLSPLTVKSMESKAKKDSVSDKKPDGGGLYFVAEPSRSSWWRFDYRSNGKQKTLSLGSYPEISLANARQLREEFRAKVANGIDPGQQRKAQRIAKHGLDSFEVIAREWWEFKKDTWTPGHADRTLKRLVNDIFPYLGSASIDSITASSLLQAIRRIEARGAFETAHRTNQVCECVFAFAIGTGRCENNPATGIRSVLKPVPPTKNLARLKDTGDIQMLLQGLKEYRGTATVRAAIQLLPITFVRPGELAKMEWRDINFEAALWTIPATVKKQRQVHKQDATKVHLVPLSKQAIDILKDLYPLSGVGKYVFTGARTAPGSKYERHMAPEAMLGALRRMGYSKEEMTSHGFRGIASTLLREVGKGKFRHEVIETQLSHTISDKTEAAYNHAIYMDERIELMQWWSDYLDDLKLGTFKG